MARTEQLTDVPDEKLAEVVRDFESEGAEVETTKQPNGKWTVTATFADDPSE